LRVATRDQHACCEQAVDLTRWLGTIEGYVRLLRVFLVFHDSVVPALGDVSTVAPLSLTRRLRGRAARCRADRAVLGVPDGPNSHPTLVAELPGLARQLGAWYVIEGSALGGTVIAHHARRSLPAAADALSFLSGDGSSSAANWREFCRFADGCNDEADLAFSELQSGAESAFDFFLSIAASS
jgi:heme oxygenase